MLNATAEVKARGAYVIGIADKDNGLFDYHIKTVNAGAADPITKLISFHLIAYFLGVKLE